MDKKETEKMLEEKKVVLGKLQQAAVQIQNQFQQVAGQIKLLQDMLNKKEKKVKQK